MLRIKESIVIVEKRITLVNLRIFSYKLLGKLRACAPSVVGNVLYVQSRFSCFLITNLLRIINTKVLILERAGQLQCRVTVCNRSSNFFHLRW